MKAALPERRQGAGRLHPALRDRGPVRATWARAARGRPLEEAAPLVAAGFRGDARALPGTVPLANALLSRVMLALDTARDERCDDRNAGRLTRPLPPSCTATGVARVRAAQPAVARAEPAPARTRRHGGGDHCSKEAITLLHRRNTAGPATIARAGNHGVRTFMSEAAVARARLDRGGDRACAGCTRTTGVVASHAAHPYYFRLEAIWLRGALRRPGNALRVPGEPRRARTRPRKTRRRVALGLRRCPGEPLARAQAEAALVRLSRRESANRAQAWPRGYGEGAGDRSHAHAELGPHLVAALSKPAARPRRPLAARSCRVTPAPPPWRISGIQFRLYG